MIRKRYLSGGNSHAKLELKIDDKTREVVKYFANPDRRDYEALNKQISYQTIEEGNVTLKACPITINDCSEGLFAEMPYLAGFSAVSLVLGSSPWLAKNMRQILQSHLSRCFDSAQEIDFDHSLYLQKLESVRSKCDNEFSRYFDICDQLIECNRGKDLRGECHGDLTLGNIIATNENSFFFIDFLHTFQESPLQDIAKILQEREFGWSARYSNLAVKNRSIIFCKAALPDPYLAVSSEFLGTLKIYEVMTLLRIIPYIRDDVTRQWMHESLRKFTRKIKR